MNPIKYDSVSIVPLMGWYDFSFGRPSHYLRKAWRDFRVCQWPDRLRTNQDINQYFLNLNIENLSITNQIVITFSHFLPRIDLMPEYIPLDKRRIYPVLGSRGLGRQVSQLKPDIHIFGHSHLNQLVKIDDISYVNNAFAYPKENRISRKKLLSVLDILD